MTIRETIREGLDRAAQWTGVKSSVLDFRDALAEIAAKHAAKLAHKVWLHTAPAPREELLAKGDEIIAAEGAKWRATYGPGLRAALTGSLIEPPDGGPATVVHFTTLLDALGPHDWAAACALRPDEMRALLAASILKLEDEGPAMASRPHLIVEDDREVTDLEQEHSMRVDEAAEVGITVAHLDIVSSRRKVDAHAAAYRQERDERDRRANAGAARRSGG